MAGAQGDLEGIGGLAQNVNGLAYLRKAAKCLAEARHVLSTIVTSAEPVSDTSASVPAISNENDLTATEPEIENEVSIKPAGQKVKTADSAQPAGDGGGGGKKGVSPGGADTAAGSSTGRVDSWLATPAAISTPLGRALVMVQLEEACVRVMMGRLNNEARSETQAAEAAANEEGVSPVQKCDGNAVLPCGCRICLLYTSPSPRD